MKTIRLLIADDHPVFRYGLKALLEAEPGFEIIAEASNGEQAVKLAKEIQPDVILMDITMPDLNGIEATRAILAEDPDIGILMVTMVDDASMFAAMRAGAREFEILSLMAKGLTNNAIAERLFLSPKTVRNQVSTIFSKLGVSDRGGAIVVAREAGLG
jgi:DNA-binding NarL/FixJ family response regulator